MAEVKSGSFNTSGWSDDLSPDYYVFNWKLVSQSIKDNYSTISWSLKGAGGYNEYYWTNVKEKYVTVNGSTQSNATIQTTYNGTTPFSGTSKIYHNSDGKKSFSASAGGAFYYYGSYNSTGSGSWTLPTIPRASSVSGGSGNIGSTSKISISRASSSFTHTLTYSFGNLTGTIATGVGTSYTWTIPTSFYAEIQNSNSGTGTITCKTYNGNTLIGTKACSFTAKVTNSNPTAGTFTYKDNNSQTVFITEDNQRIIRENSNLLFTIGTATPQNSATISKYEITFNGVTQSRTSAGDLDFGIINLSRNETATLKVTDSRGNTATKEIEVIIDDWVLPKGTISLNRKNNYYSETYLKVDGSYSSLNGKNTMAIQYQYKKISEKNFTELYDLEDNVQATLDLDNNYKWHVIVIVGDRLGETTYNLYLDRGMPIIYFDRLNENVGINCFPNSEYKFDVDGDLRGKNLPIATGLNSLSDFDKVEAGQYLYKSGFYSVNVDNVWYHLLNIRHRNGYSDGTTYGLQIRKPFGLNSTMQMRSQNAGTWSGWEEVCRSKTLYENSSGSASTITLNEAVENFQYIEVFGVGNSSMCSVKIPINLYDTGSLYTTGASSMYHCNIKLSGTSLTFVYNRQIKISDGTVTNSNAFKIYKVIGYR